MPRDGAIIFSDLIGKLDLLRVACDKCGILAASVATSVSILATIIAGLGNRRRINLTIFRK
jgi:hypothetical protein